MTVSAHGPINVPQVQSAVGYPEKDCQQIFGDASRMRPDFSFQLFRISVLAGGFCLR